MKVKTLQGIIRRFFRENANQNKIKMYCKVAAQVTSMRMCIWPRKCKLQPQHISQVVMQNIYLLFCVAVGICQCWRLGSGSDIVVAAAQAHCPDHLSTIFTTGRLFSLKPLFQLRLDRKLFPQFGDYWLGLLMSFVLPCETGCISLKKRAENNIVQKSSHVSSSVILCWFQPLCFCEELFLGLNGEQEVTPAVFLVLALCAEQELLSKEHYFPREVCWGSTKAVWIFFN